MLTTVMMMPAMASPLTNFIAPSIAPNSWLSRSRSRRLRLPSSMSMAPARRSASMDICLPGMASRVKRAATSATRSEPLEMTMKFTITRMTKITAPTTKLPRTTKLPNATTTSPGSPVEQDEARRRDGERQPVHRGDEQQRREDRQLQRAAVRRAKSAACITEMLMFRVSSTSSSIVGSGTIIIPMMATTTQARTMSEYLDRKLLLWADIGSSQSYARPPPIPKPPPPVCLGRLDAPRAPPGETTP